MGLRSASAALLTAFAAAASASPALAGGPVLRVVVTGAGGQERVLALDPSSTQEYRLLVGERAVARPDAPYLRLFPLFAWSTGLLVGRPGRYYPGAGVVCDTDTRFPRQRCHAIDAATARLLAPARLLPPLAAPPPFVARVLLPGGRPAGAPGAMLATAAELAFSRRGRPGAPPAAAIPLEIVWGGPQAASRTRHVLLGRAALYVQGELRPLPAGVYRFVRPFTRRAR